MDEIFLEDDETGLLVSNLGRVVGKGGNELIGKIDKGGYRRVTISLSRLRKKQLFVHRLVARNFIPNPRNLPQVNHKDENKLNNTVCNLEWCDSKYNNSYGTKMSRTKQTMSARGITTKCSLVKDSLSIECDSISELARKIGTTPSHVKGVIDGKYSHAHGWHLPGVLPKHNNLPVEITITNGNETVHFKSLSDAAKRIGCTPTEIGRLLQGELKMSHGWHLPGIKQRKSCGPIRLTNGKDMLEFKNLADAARHFGVYHGIMSAIRDRRQKTVKGWHLV